MIPTGPTKHTLTLLLPGESSEFRVKAGNLAGVSEPSNTVSHTPAPKGMYSAALSI